MNLRKFPSLRTHMHQDRYAIGKFIRVVCNMRMAWPDVIVNDIVLTKTDCSLLV